ncbi:MAG: hypothetical protein ABDH61_03635 [Acidilobaceae archaeon]
MRGGSPGDLHTTSSRAKFSSSSTIGRIRLSQALGIGEASAKTLIARLKELGLAETFPDGMRASRKGRRY